MHKGVICLFLFQKELGNYSVQFSSNILLRCYILESSCCMLYSCYYKFVWTNPNISYHQVQSYWSQRHGNMPAVEISELELEITEAQERLINRLVPSTFLKFLGSDYNRLKLLVLIAEPIYCRDWCTLFTVSSQVIMWIMLLFLLYLVFSPGPKFLFDKHKMQNYLFSYSLGQAWDVTLYSHVKWMQRLDIETICHGIHVHLAVIISTWRFVHFKNQQVWHFILSELGRETGL